MKVHYAFLFLDQLVRWCLQWFVSYDVPVVVGGGGCDVLVSETSVETPFYICESFLFENAGEQYVKSTRGEAMQCNTVTPLELFESPEA